MSHLHRDAEALVKREEAAAFDDLAEAVDQPCELACARLSQVSCQPGTRKVQRVHNQQGSGSGKTTCMQHTISTPAPRMDPANASLKSCMPKAAAHTTEIRRRMWRGSPPEAMLMAKNFQKSVLGLALGKRFLMVSLKAKLKACVGKYRMTLARLPRQKDSTPCSADTRVKQFPIPA